MCADITNIMIIDTETTGLPNMLGFDSYYNPSLVEKYDSSRMIELGYVIYDNKQRLIKEYSSLVKPDRFTINNSEIHGITQEDAERDGKSIINVLNDLSKDLTDVHLIVAHNVNFDINIILSECYRSGHNNLVKKIKSINTYCTAKASRCIYGKHLKLIDLYEKLHGKDINQEHRALSDAKYCSECYFSLNNLSSSSDSDSSDDFFI